MEETFWTRARLKNRRGQGIMWLGTLEKDAERWPSGLWR